MNSPYVSAATVRFLLPEMVLIGVATFIYLAGAFVKSRRLWSWAAGAGLAAAALCLYFQTSDPTSAPAANAADSPLFADGLMMYVRWLSLGVGALLLLTAAQGAVECQAA